jgi:hypothetical protein
MNLRIAIALGAAVPALFAVPGIAQDAQSGEDALAEKVVNNTNPASFQAYGFTPPPKLVGDKGVQGGKALRLPVTGSGNPWSAGSQRPADQAGQGGGQDRDRFLCPAEQGRGADRQARRPAPAFGGALYRDLLEELRRHQGSWQFLQLAGKADKDYPAGSVGAAHGLPPQHRQPP